MFTFVRVPICTINLSTEKSFCCAYNLIFSMLLGTDFEIKYSITEHYVEIYGWISSKWNILTS